MPTSSTAKLLSKHHDKANSQLSRRRRPNSCKYDSYRLRSRTSIVDENLFGEPLKNKLMSRSRSMEVINNSSGPPRPCGQENLEENRLFTKHLPPPRLKSKATERPKTALANMRVSKRSEDPEFEKGSGGQGGEPGVVRVVTKDLIRSLIVPRDENVGTAQPLFLSKRDYYRIKQASMVIPAEERLRIQQEQDELRQSTLKQSEEQRVALRNAALGYTEQERTGLTESEQEKQLKCNQILERAQNIFDEELPEVKKINEAITRAKCHAVIDNQLEEKEKRLQEMAEADRHLEEEMEIERKKAEEIEQNRQKALKDYIRDYRRGLDEQKNDLEAMKLLELERREKELEARKKEEAEAILKDKEQEILKKQKVQQLQRRISDDIAEIKQRKAIIEDREKERDMNILALQNSRREVELARERHEKETKRIKERELLRLKDELEESSSYTQEREKLRYIRQKDALDREWKRKELEEAKAKVEQEREIKRIRDDQVRQKTELAARAVETERDYWQRSMTEFNDKVQADKCQEEEEIQRRRQNLNDLKRQMEEKRKEKHQERERKIEDSNKAQYEQRAYQERIEKIKERKLEQLRAYNVPEKYFHEVEKRCQFPGKSRFTASYFGKK